MRPQRPAILTCLLFSLWALVRPQRPVTHLLCIRSLSRRSCACKDLSYVATYPYPVGVLVRPRRPVIRPYVFGRVIHLGRRVSAIERNYCRRGTPRRCRRTSVYHSFPVPVPLPKLTRACPSYGCFHVLISALTAEAVVLVMPTQRWSKGRTAKCRKRSPPNLSLALLCAVGHVRPTPR